MDINDQTESTVDVVEMTQKESTFKDDVILGKVRETNTDSTVGLLSNIDEENCLKDDGIANGCNDIPRKEEDILNGVNEVAATPISNDEVTVTPISNDEDVASEEEIHTGVAHEESVAASEENFLTRVVNEESNVSGDNEKGSCINATNKVVDSTTVTSVSMDLEMKYESSKQNSASMLFDLDANHTIYRSGNVDDEVTSDSESDSTKSLSSSSSSEDEAPKKPIVKEKTLEEEKNIEKPKVKGELGIKDLPPIEELKITVDENVELVCVGLISTIIDSLVVIQSLESESSPLNDDSILFLEDRTSLGQVFEIFGPVRCPLYSVRFNSSKDIKEKGLEVGMKIYYAPKEIKYTNYVFVNDLIKQKGSDASWEHDLEPPDKFLDYSDDEKERTMKKNKKKPHVDNSESDTETSKDGKNQAQRKRVSNNPFYLKNKSPLVQKNKNYKKRYEGDNHQGYRNAPEFNPHQYNNWNSNAYTSWPPTGPRNQLFEAFGNMPPNPTNWALNPSSSWATNPSNSWSTNPPNQWPSNPANNWAQTEASNWVPNSPNNWSSENSSNKWPTNISNNWSQNTPNNWSQNTPNNWSQNNSNSLVQNTPNSSTQSTPNNWSEISPNNWTQNNPNNWPQNNLNISAQNASHDPSQINSNVCPSNWPNNWPPNPNNPPPNFFSIPPPNVLSSNSTSNPFTNLPNNPAPNAPSWTQNSQLSYPQTKGFLPSSNH